MSRSRVLKVAILLMVLVLTLPLVVRADIVGHLTQVEGRVDLLKDGKLPAIPVKLQDGVESKDVVRTKSLSKAQITFIDNSSVTISPESRVAIEEYLFDPAQKKRSAVLNIFQGLAHVVVTKLFKVDEPDFVVKTHTAITGVRGTDFGVRIHPNGSTILNFQGLTQVANIFPEVGQLFRRAFMVAYSFGPPGSPNSVLLKDMQGTTVGRGLPPTLPFAVTPQDQQQFMNQMGSGLVSRKSNPQSTGGTAPASSGGGAAATDSGGGAGAAGTTTTASLVSSSMENLGGPGSGLGTTVPAIAPVGLTTGTGNAGVTLINTVTVPPQPGPTTNPTTAVATTTPTTSTTPITPTTDTTIPPTPTTQAYSFISSSQSAWNSTMTSSTTNTVTSTGWGMRSGIAVEGTQPLPESYAGYFTTSGTGDRTVIQGAPFAGSSTGVSISSMTGTVTGALGSTLTGTATVTGINSFGETQSWTGTVTIEPSGKMTFAYAGTLISTQRLTEATGTNTSIPGTYFTQVLSGVMSNTSTSPYNSQSTTTTLAGARSTGLPSTYYSVNVTGGTTTNPWNFSFMPRQYSDLSGTLAGVVSRTESGILYGAAIILPGSWEGPFVSSLPTPPSPYLFGEGVNGTIPIVSTVHIDPATGVLSGSVFTTEYQSGRYSSQVYGLSQAPQSSPVTTPASATYAFEQTYHGASWMNYGLSGPGSTLQTNGNGWGLTTGVSNPSWAPGALALPAPYSGTTTGNTGWFTAFDQGTWNVTSGVWPSSFSSGYSAAVGVTQMRGTVSGIPGQTLTGTNMTFIGSLLNGFSFSYSGPVTIEADGDTKFNYTGTWAKAGTTDAASGTASGIMGQYPGYHFVQRADGTYSLTSVTDSSGKRYNGTLTIPFSNWTGNVAGASTPVNDLGGTASLYSLDGTLPASGIGTGVTLEGVVGNSSNGAIFGLANLSLGSPLNVSIPGYTVLTSGGAIFNTGGVFVQPSGTSPTSVVNVQPATLSQALYSFAETYNGFRLGTGTTPFTVANSEGYGWGAITGTGASPLPTSYTGGSSTGYFVSQDLGTRASLTAMAPGYASVTGSLTGTLSGVSGQTLSGQMSFTGQNSRGANLNYQGTATLATNGTLVWNYYGTWSSGSTSGTGSGTWTQVLGTYFEETINSGSFVQAASSTTIGGTTYSSATVQDSTPLTGTRKVGTGAPTSTTGSFAGIRTSTVNTFGSASGAVPNMTIKGVVAGSDWQTKWGVATISGAGSPAGSTKISGPVTLDPAGKLTGQFVDVIPTGSTTPVDNVTVNLVSVPAGTGQTTSSFVQTVSGNVTQTPVGTTPTAQATLTTPTALTGTSTGLMSGNIDAKVALTSMAVTPVYVTAGTGPMSAQIIGAVGGPAGGPQTGVASMHSIKTIGGRTSQHTHLGTATHQPATVTTPATLTTTLQGLNNFHSGVAASQAGTVTITPR